jgi:tRNA A37 threonylcarbamoyladenosine modification protein TsaB
MFSVSKTGDVAELDTASHISPARLLEKYSEFQSLIWGGGGAGIHRELLKEHAHSHGIAFNEGSQPASGIGWTLAPSQPNLARSVAALALKALLEGRVESAQSLRAIYVRPSDAELNSRCL